MAALTGRNDEWIGPGNLFGAAEMVVIQNGRIKENFKSVYESGKAFTVHWYYSPSNAEIDAGATSRQHVAESFRGKTGYFAAIGAMYKLRREILAQGEFYTKGGLIPF